MAISDFDFSSPGVQFREVDQSTTPEATPNPGITIIGTAPAGPGMVPTRVTSIEQFERVFGKPNNGQNSPSNVDVYRNGNTQLPNYGMYAAKAWLASGESPVTFIRLLGQDSESDEQGAGYQSAGWNLGGAVLSPEVTSNVGAMGLFIQPSGAATVAITGTLAAVIYVTGAAVTLSGTSCLTSEVTSAAGTLIKSLGSDSSTFRLAFYDDQTNVSETFTVSLKPDSGDFIRKVINTNPQKLYSNNFATTKKYFLGETYEESVKRLVTDIDSTNGQAILLPLELNSGAASANFVNHLSEAKAPKTGWIISRDPNPENDHENFRPDNMEKLFKVHSLHEGEWMHSYHIRISELRLGTVVNPNSTFTLEVVKGETVVEKFANLNLDKSSADYAPRRIGTSYQSWDNANKVFDDVGRYRSRSNFIRLEESENLKNGAISDDYKIPWGFWGPVRPKGFTMISGAVDQRVYTLGTANGGTDGVTNVYVKKARTAPHGAFGTTIEPEPFSSLAHDMTASFIFPRFKLTEYNTRGGANYTETMDMGVRQAFADSSKYGLEAVKHRKDYIDLCRHQVYDLHGAVGTNLEQSFIFSMDDIVSENRYADVQGHPRWYWSSGSHAAGTAYTKLSGSAKMTKYGPRAFNIPLFGGSDGLDITQIDPFSNKNVLTSTATKATTYAYNSVWRALDMTRDAEKLRASLISVPGLTNTKLIKEVVNIVEERGDSLAIIDYDDGSQEAYENSGTRTRGSVDTVIDTSETLQIDSNKAAVYFPKVEISEDGYSFMAPASVAAIGALAFNDANSAGPWFAPAGFNRGGLSVLGGTLSNLSVGLTDKNLTKKNRDDLYREHINPIARFPAVGEVVIFGQKTLYKSQPTSALSRVNVRRLMIFLRQRISDIADTVLFEPNVATTFNNFSVRCQTVLENVKSNFGITEYKITRIEEADVEGTGIVEDLRDRNILYVRIFVKPARAIEFIAIDFVISRSDAQF